VEIIPSIDISDGRCVKRIRGRAGTGLSLGDPVEQALRWEKRGARRLHVVDLDGAARGYPVNREVVEKILRAVSIPVQVGGGIREVEHAIRYLEHGARWIILGTGILEDPSLLEKLIGELGPRRIIAALDYDERGNLVKRGWAHKTGISVIEYARELDGLNLEAFLCTYTPLEGTMKGVDLVTVRMLTEKLKTPVIYAGGIRSIEDLKVLREAGVKGVVIGMALYTGRIRLEKAIELCG